MNSHRLAQCGSAMLAVAAIAGCHGRTGPAAVNTTPACTFHERAFRSGVDLPRQIYRSEPDFAGLSAPPPDQVFIVEVRIDAGGRVAEACMRRGDNQETDRRVLDAVKGWTFEPPRLKDAVTADGERWDAGAAVPVVLTVTVRTGRSR
ncbi:MAG: hypothetical protein R2752_15150 [Vicinamibacterales bacterium]